jgi:transketolase
VIVDKQDRDILSINTLRVLGVEAVQNANSGHPGIVLGAAPMAWALWSKVMSHNPNDSQWINRDRFVLSPGHGSALLYSLLCLFGYDVSLDDLRLFRQLRSKVPGHPEYGLTDGVETSTGPLGQGLANAVGMAQAESILAAKFNKHNLRLIDHYTYCIVSDGDMMEGISYEAASLAGLWQLNKLVVLYDSNGISIDGSTDLSFDEDIAKRYDSVGWYVQSVDGMDHVAVHNALQLAKRQTSRPSLIVARTIIGFGSDKSNSESSHGAPLGAESVLKLRQVLGYDTPQFVVDSVVSNYIDSIKESLNAKYALWQDIESEYKLKHPQEYAQLTAYLRGKDAWVELAVETLSDMSKSIEDKPDATRNSSGQVINQLSKVVPNLVCGSADLSLSNKVNIVDGGSYGANNRLGRNVHYGVREHAMVAISNGMWLHGGCVAVVSTFFVFSDYAKGAIRMSALMNLPSMHVFSHDSIGVGEDGCTHQPIEQLVGLRSVPNLRVYRPADTTETIAAYISWLQSHQPYALVLSRQDLPQVSNQLQSALKGGYILSPSRGNPQSILIATGSEVQYALQAQQLLWHQGVDSRVVSMPCCEIFDLQPIEYRQHVLPNECRVRVAVEAASSISWYKYVGIDGAVVGMDTFGLSGKSQQLFEHFGFGADNIVKIVKSLLV